MTLQRLLTHRSRHALVIAGVLTLAACASEPSRPMTVAREPPPSPDTNVYFYPLSGRSMSAEQQDRDKYECSAWAVQNTGFDPSLPDVPPHQRVRVVADDPPPGTGTAAAALTGAFLGGALGSPWRFARAQGRGCGGRRTAAARVAQPLKK